MSEIRTVVDSRCPDEVRWKHGAVIDAINSVVICTGSAWEDVVKCLIEQAHIRSNMPIDATCVTDMIRASGFAPMSHYMTIRELVEICEEAGNFSKAFIVRVALYGYLAVVPNEDGDGYVIKCMYQTQNVIENRRMSECWMYVPGTDNRTGIKRDIIKRNGRTKSHRELELANVNPMGRNVGDCSVRALCAALECTWDEAVDLLAKANGYKDPVINTMPNINNVLIMLDFERHKMLKLNGKRLTGKQFCDAMTKTYHNGERIFAYVGKNHCAAFLPFEEPDGSVLYKAQDTWDSTDRRIEDYWVIPPKAQRMKAAEPEREAQPEAEAPLSVGGVVTHPTFGKGVIRADSGTVLTIEFESVGVKKLSKDWLTKTKK